MAEIKPYLVAFLAFSALTYHAIHTDNPQVAYVSFACAALLFFKAISMARDSIIGI